MYYLYIVQNNYSNVLVIGDRDIKIGNGYFLIVSHKRNVPNKKLFIDTLESLLCIPL